MARVDIIKSLYKKQVPYSQFVFDNLKAYPLLSYIHPMAIVELNKIANSVKLQSNPVKKMNLYDEILKPYNFRRLTAGTNRVVYKHLEDQRIVLKVAKDAVGINDNPSEWVNQQYLKPFVTKCFEVSPCGTVGLFERVQPITSKAEFISISQDIFALLYKIIGKYVLEDIGSNFFLNYGLRDDFGPVLLDYPYMFELDGRKIICNQPDFRTGLPCGGEIDYDDGFNNLICTKCGKVYLATDLQKNRDCNNIIIEPSPREKGGLTKMKLAVVNTTYDEKWNVTKQERVTDLDVLPETSSIISKEEYKRGISIRVNESSDNKKLGDYNKAKKKHKLPNPNFEVEVVSPGESKPVQEPEQVNTQNKTNPQRRPFINQKNGIRSDVYAMKPKPEKKELEKEEDRNNVNEEYIQRELMGKVIEEETADNTNEKEEPEIDYTADSFENNDEEENAYEDYEDSVTDLF